MIRRTVGRNGGRMLFGLVLLVIGGYYFLRNTLGFDLGELDEEAIWPVIVVLFGAWIFFRGVTESAEEPTPR